MTDYRLIKVLVVEDDEFIAMVYQDQLAEVSNINFELEVYGTLAEGIAAAKAGGHDVMLLDLNLPDSDSTHTIKSISQLSDLLPVIIMTSTNSELIALTTMNQGSQDYLVKSMLEKTLLVRSILYSIERHQLKIQLKDAIEIAENQKRIAEQKNKEILESITYAHRIQSAILPSDRFVKSCLNEHFIIFLPKDIVAGDFYWLEKIDNSIYLAACDCTGHGVPGAMVSIVCHNAMNRALIEFNERDPGAIFDRTRQLILENFSKSDDEVMDGMDASLVRIDPDVNGKVVLSWSGANNPLWIHRRGAKDIEEIKATKQPVGKSESLTPFATHKIELNHGDSIYLFTDGFADQFGGDNVRKLTKKRFREALLEFVNLPMNEQYFRLLEFHKSYRGENEQIDDICLLGVRF